MCVARSLVSGGLKVGVSPASVTTFQKNKNLILCFCGKLPNQLPCIVVKNRGSGGHGNNYILTIFAKFISPLSIPTIAGFKYLLITHMG